MKKLFITLTLILGLAFSVSAQPKLTVEKTREVYHVSSTLDSTVTQYNLSKVFSFDELLQDDAFYLIGHFTTVGDNSDSIFVYFESGLSSVFNYPIDTAYIQGNSTDSANVITLTPSRIPLNYISAYIKPVGTNRANGVLEFYFTRKKKY